MCKPHKYAQQGDGERQGLSLQREFGRSSRINRHDLPDETVHSAPSRKDKRFNCGGKVGRSHQAEIVFSPPVPSSRCRPSSLPFNDGWGCWHREICGRCGKVLQYCLDSKDCPDYVTAESSRS